MALEKNIFELLKVLIVDDKRSMQESFKYLMIEWGYLYEMASNGQEAVEKARTIYFDICFMDINMPVMNGCEATKAIRSFSKDLPILAVTGNSSDDEVREYLKIGMNDVMSKPYNSMELHEKIIELTTKRYS